MFPKPCLGPLLFDTLAHTNSFFSYTPEVQPLITMEDLQIVEGVCRKSPAVIEQCGILGIPPEDMHKV